MVELGKIQKLAVVKLASQGIYLNEKENNDKDGILLPKNEVPSGILVGDEIEVFVYKDSQDRIIATTKNPKIKMNEITSLKVVDKTKIGAFLDWGLPKDLFLPFKEQGQKIQVGEYYLVSLYVDKSSRLCATMNISKRLESKAPYEKNDRVKGTIYSINSEIGAFVAIDDKYQGLIPRKELYGNYKLGDKIEAIVTNIKPDGKIDLRMRPVGYKQMENDTKKLLDTIIRKGGRLNLNDKSSPVKIREELQMSKSGFKRATGRLLKARIIEFSCDGIRLKK